MLQSFARGSISDFIESTNNTVLSFSACSSKVKEKGFLFKFRSSSVNEDPKHILRDVSAVLHGGTDIAIMGPSGAGKSTLLNLLTLVPSEAEIQGDVRINGHPLTDVLFKRHCAYVPQEDHLWPFLTCREMIEYSVDFYLDLATAERKDRVDRLLVDLGIESCQNTRCGGQFIQGLSGGQRRRLSLALALVKNPAVLFLDELTSGLDSHAAAEIMAVVRRVARAGRIVVVCTIHQPSARVFNAFDSVMLLSGGRVAYAGAVADVSDYFASACERAPPADLTVAEFVIEMVNSDFGGPEKKAQVARLLSAWAERTSAMLPSAPVDVHSLPDKTGPTTPLSKQVPCNAHERLGLLLNSWT